MPIWSKIAELDLVLPDHNHPMANYLPAMREGNLVFVSGQLPLGADDQLMMAGPIDDTRIPEAKAAARQCFLNALAAAATVVDINSIVGTVRMAGYVASAPGFYRQPWVLDGASELSIAIFGDNGRHARAALGVNSLPLNASIEIEVIFKVLGDNGFMG
jgi:enamine deaminase RidA (YjgF/YER057c/UK114 family)